MHIKKDGMKQTGVVMISAAGSLNIVFNKDRFVSSPIAIKVSVLVNAIIKKSIHKS
jgi:hypothetical protein